MSGFGSVFQSLSATRIWAGEAFVKHASDPDHTETLYPCKKSILLYSLELNQDSSKLLAALVHSC